MRLPSALSAVRSLTFRLFWISHVGDPGRLLDVLGLAAATHLGLASEPPVTFLLWVVQPSVADDELPAPVASS